MKYLFAPANGMARPASAKGPARSVVMVAGEVYDLDPAWAKVVNGLVEGKDGNPALVPVEAQADAPKAAPKADSKADSKPEPKPAKGKAAPSTPAPGVEVT